MYIYGGMFVYDTLIYCNCKLSLYLVTLIYFMFSRQNKGWNTVCWCRCFILCSFLVLIKASCGSDLCSRSDMTESPCLPTAAAGGAEVSNAGPDTHEVEFPRTMVVFLSQISSSAIKKHLGLLIGAEPPHFSWMFFSPLTHFTVELPEYLLIYL